MQETEFEINRDAVKKYFQASQTFLCFIATVWYCGLGIIVALIYYFAIGEWLCPQ